MSSHRIGGWLGLTAVMISLNATAAEATWSVDKAHSRVGFSVKHFGINTVYGTFSKYDAEVVADDKGRVSKVSAKVAAASIDTDIEKRDDHLRSPELFDVAKYPDIRMTTTSIRWNGKKLSGKADLTIKGKTVKVAFSGKLTGTRTVTANGKNELRAGYEVSAKIDRTKFGLDFGGMTEALGMVGDTVTISLNIEIARPM
jgi:polyisoprenoid-binding protein YceI